MENELSQDTALEKPEVQGGDGWLAVFIPA